MLKHEQIDLLDITAIESEHYTLAMLGLDAGCHLLVEKPLTINYDHSLRLYETALQKNLYFYTGRLLRRSISGISAAAFLLFLIVDIEHYQIY